VAVAKHVELLGARRGLGLAQGVAQLVCAGGAAWATGVALKGVCNLVDGLALNQLANGLKVAVAAALKGNALDGGTVITQVNVDGL